MRIAAALLCIAGPVWADDAALLGYMGGQGCTFGVQSMAGAVAAGFDAVDIDMFITEALERGDASRQGLYTVLDESICTIRLPDVQSPTLVNSPEVMAIAPYISETEEIGGERIVTEGCFLENGQDLFKAMNDGDEDAGNAAYLRFLGAGIIAGELRYYAGSPLATPRGFQLTVGKCDAAPNLEQVKETQPLIAEYFAEYVRRVGEVTVCGERAGNLPQIAAEVLRLDLSESGDGDDNGATWGATWGAAWMWLEWDIIMRAAGWYDDVSANNRGTPRPPLCHFPDQ